jgi:hypothetical protein
LAVLVERDHVDRVELDHATLLPLDLRTALKGQINRRLRIRRFDLGELIHKRVLAGEYGEFRHGVPIGSRRT